MNLFHYTDVGALQKILHNKKLRLSDIRFLNDHYEYKDGEGIIREVFLRRSSEECSPESEKALIILDDVIRGGDNSYTFICSFSQKEDLLSQWRGYCPKAGGYAIELEFLDAKLGRPLIYGAPVHKCIYDYEEKVMNAEKLYKSIVSDVTRGADHSHMLKKIWSNIAKCKNSGFFEESEIRLIHFKNISKTVEYRTRDNLIVPYIEAPISLESIKSIWIGPCQNPDLAEQGLRYFLNSMKSSFAGGLLPEIKKSRTTLRV